MFKWYTINYVSNIPNFHSQIAIPFNMPQNYKHNKKIPTAQLKKVW